MRDRAEAEHGLRVTVLKRRLLGSPGGRTMEGFEVGLVYEDRMVVRPGQAASLLIPGPPEVLATAYWTLHLVTLRFG